MALNKKSEKIFDEAVKRTIRGETWIKLDVALELIESEKPKKKKSD